MRTVLGMILVTALAAQVGWAAPTVDDTPAESREWGFRPAEGSVSARTPPSFSWRPQKGAASYSLQASRDRTFARVDYEAARLPFTVHCPPRIFEPGAWAWRFRFTDHLGNASTWSRVRRFEVAEDAAVFPLPPREELLARVPKEHPRLFLRPEGLARLRDHAQGEAAADFHKLVRRAETLLESPPPTAEPPEYPDGVKRKSEAWRKIWWGNRRYTIALLDGAATLAFTWRLGGKEAYGQLARRLLMAATDWDPRGSTGYRTNDEAGMPFAYHFSRTYTLVHPLLTESERRKCRAVMRIRGHEMYRHLHRRHLWRPYSSHANRAWHFLGEVAIAFLDEIPEAADWLWFAVNVFANAYPVWCDDDGGWHEGVNYWRSYVARFVWWAFVMEVALDLDAWRLPYFSKVGYYPLYLMPPGTVGGGFGDLNGRRRSEQNTSLVSVLAARARNPHWQWYVDAHGGSRSPSGWIGFLHAVGASPESRPPTDLPTARLFRGTGIAALNTNLLDAKDNVEILFKSSPFGSQSHGYEAQNSFLLYAYGERLLIRSGRRDIYGSAHHKDWMWETRSVNSITVNGCGQIRHSPAAVGEITDFHASERIHWVEGEAGRAYARGVKRFTRGILFVTPDLIVIRDRLETTEPSTFEWHLHAPVPFEVEGNEAIVRGKRAACRVSFLEPAGLGITTTDRFDPAPRSRVQLTEYHLTAVPPLEATEITFVTVIRVRRAGAEMPAAARITPVQGGWRLLAPLTSGRAEVLVRRGDEGVGVVIRDASGGSIARFAAHGGTLRED